MTNEIPKTFVDVLSMMNDNFHDTADSLPEYVGGTRNDFLTLVEADVADMPECQDILGVANTLVASYYLAAFTLHVGIPGVDVRGELDKFAVERSPLKTAIKFALGLGVAYLTAKGAKKSFGRESYVGTLGAPGDYGKILATESYHQASVDDLYEEIEARERKLDERERKMRDMRDSMKRSQEKEQIRREREKLDRDKSRAERVRQNLKGDAQSAKNEREKLKLDRERDEFEKSKETSTSVSIGKQDLDRSLQEGGSLSTGKTFEMTLERDGNTMPLTLNIGLSVIVGDKPGMKSILGVSDYEFSFENRKMLASAGARSWIRDIMLSRDLIDQMRKNRRNDKTGFYKTVVAARNKNWLASAFGNISVNNASSVIVVSQETVDEMEPIIGGNLSEFDVRQRLFKDTLTMLIFVVDKRWETITIYHRGLNRHTELDFRALSRSKGGNKMDVDEIIRAYQAGNAPLGR